MSDEVRVEKCFPLAILDEAGRPLWHIAHTNPPQYAYDTHLEALWNAGEQLRMKHERAIKLATLALESECQRQAVNANLFEQYHLDTPATRNAARRRADCRAATRTLQQPQQSAMELEVA